MARGGRKRKTGKRQPNGRLVPNAEPPNLVAQYNRLVMAAKLEGLPADLSYSLGREYYFKHITKDQFEAGVMWSELVDKYNRAKGYPRKTAQSPDFEPKIPQTGEGSEMDERLRDAIFSRHDNAHAELTSVGMMPERIVNRVCVDGNSCEYFNREHLKDGLTALADHFGLTAASKSRRNAV